ncbi:MAG: DUF6036 family nucleotidyltransferase [Planctomycetaceae bacterium]
MNALYEAALEVQGFFESRQWRFCIIGGLAVVRWGQPRATQDVDLSLLTEFGSEAEYVDSILREFEGRLNDAAEFALQSRVVLAKAANGIPLDIALAGFPFEAQTIERATPFEYASGVVLITASAEDLVVLKSFAGRDQDWSDVQGILVRQRDELDWPYISRELTGLCRLDGNTEPAERLTHLRSQVEGGGGE